MECRRISTFFLLGHLLRLALGPDVEADDDGVRGRRQQHVALGDGADAGAQHLDANLFVRKLGQQIVEHFHRALHVALEDDVQFLHAAILSCSARPSSETRDVFASCGFAAFCFAVLGDVARLVASATTTN